jgi:hypothetical protein
MKTAIEHPRQTVVVVTDAYFSLKGLTGYSGLSVRTLRGYLTSRKSPLPFFRIGDTILVRRSDFVWAARFVEIPLPLTRLSMTYAGSVREDTRLGVKVQFYRGAWWIVIHHHGRRRKKRIGPDRETAERVARALREKWFAAR